MKSITVYISIVFFACVTQRRNDASLAESVSVLNSDGAYFYLPLKIVNNEKVCRVLITNFELYNMKYNSLDFDGEFTDTLVSIFKNGRFIDNSFEIYSKNYIIDEKYYKMISDWSAKKIYRKYFDLNGNTKDMFSDKEIAAAVYAIAEKGVVVYIPSYSNSRYNIKNRRYLLFCILRPNCFRQRFSPFYPASFPGFFATFQRGGVVELQI
jgi:hypothetical protein